MSRGLVLCGLLVAVCCSAALASALPQPLPSPSESASIYEAVADSAVHMSRRKRSAENDDESDSGTRTTDKCNAPQMQEFFAENDACFAQANSKLFEALASGKVDQGLCDLVTAKAKCIEKLAPKCFNREESNNVLLNFLKKQYNNFNEDSAKYGQLLRTCAVLRSFETQYLARVAGTADKCSYSDYQKRLVTFKACNKRVGDERNRLTKLAIDFLSGSSVGEFIITAECNARREWDNKCNPPFFSCLSSSKSQEYIQADLKSYASNEDNLQSAGITTFTYAKSCKSTN